MTLYAGETARIKSSATDFNGLNLTNVQVTSATVEIWNNSTKAVILAATTMSYDSSNKFWYYDWNTTGQNPITYLVKVRLQGTGFDTWEYQRFRLSPNPVA